MRRRQMMAEVTSRLLELHTTIDAGAPRGPARFGKHSRALGLE